MDETTQYRVRFAEVEAAWRKCEEARGRYEAALQEWRRWHVGDVRPDTVEQLGSGVAECDQTAREAEAEVRRLRACQVRVIAAAWLQRAVRAVQRTLRLGPGEWRSAGVVTAALLTGPLALLCAVLGLGPLLVLLVSACGFVALSWSAVRLARPTAVDRVEARRQQLGSAVVAARSRLHGASAELDRRCRSLGQARAVQDRARLYDEARKSWGHIEWRWNLQRNELADEARWRHLRSGPFEEFLAEVLEGLGYRVERTGRTGDKGVDLIATDPRGHRTAIQAKGYEGSVDKKAVLEVLDGNERKYRCDARVAVTNSYFTPDAKEAATYHACGLIEGRELPGLVRGESRIFPPHHLPIAEEC